jgi:hypothetical protein
MTDCKLTGRRRYRSQRRWGGREELVLQVEERWLHTYYSGGSVDSDWIVSWRDARTSDLTTIGEEP